MRKFLANIKSVILYVVLGILCCGLLGMMGGIFAPVFNFIQSLLLLFLFIVCLPAALYRYNNGRKDKLISEFKEKK